MSGIKVDDLLAKGDNEFELTLLAGDAGLQNRILAPGINRPGLALAGYMENFPCDRLQLLGKRELSYLSTLSAKKRREHLGSILGSPIPCIILISDASPPSELLKIAQKKAVPVLRSSLGGSMLIPQLHDFLEKQFEPRTSIHAVLVDLYGVGVLLIGKSGIGKSECALELISRGHRLVADDVVDIKLKAGKYLMGNGAELIRHHMEIRGLGVINISKLFGARAVRNQERVGLVVQLEDWDAEKAYDRIGLMEENYEMLGVKVPMITVPVKPGRNISTIIEVAALNQRLIRMGYHSAREFNERLIGWMQEEKKLIEEIKGD